MKISLLHGPFCLAGGANGFDFARLWTDPRGLSGSDLGVFRIAQELARLGHEVKVGTYPKPGTPIIPDALGPGVRIHHYDDRLAEAEGFDAIVSWNECEPLECFKDRDVLRICSVQINTVVSQRYDLGFVDAWLSPSRSHREMMIATPQRIGRWREEIEFRCPAEKWHVVPDGCDPDVYEKLRAYGVGKEPGLVSWTSSPDRGLHWLLSVWPKIKRSVPNARLAISYELRRWVNHMLNQSAEEFDPSITEQIKRANYVAHALERMPGLDVVEMGSLSRRDVNQLQARSECVAYSADPPIWSEGYSCSLMEACAARSGPVTTNVDAFGEIYGDALPLSPRPTSETILEFAENVIRVLRDEKFRSELNDRAFELAKRNTWTKAAERLSEIISERRSA